MIVSWNWLKDYVTLDMEPAELEYRLAMAGLNHEQTRPVGDDLAIDLEVTSNRPDCLGHLGVAREIAVLWERELRVPQPELPAGRTPIGEFVRVRLECPELCYRYTARVMRGVKVGPSPHWLVRRLETLGVPAINNVVDVTNYVLLECGQPLHAFDLDRLAGPEVVVRQGRAGENFQAIDHKTYTLEPGMCVIADGHNPVALGGIMGGVESEVSTGTTQLLVEAAEFAPLATRTTARKLKLHSDSSYRFERGVDPQGVDWASRRCCELILQLAGGELADGVLDVGRGVPTRCPLVLRLSQLKRILGIEVPPAKVRQILTALGAQWVRDELQTAEIVPPSWRSDLTREIDLVEEVGRIYGYDRIPEDVGVPMAPSHCSDEERVLSRVRHVLTAAGFDEAVTASVVPAQWSQTLSPWTDALPLQCLPPMLKGADRLRLSLLPSLLDCRRVNQSLANPVVELFETAPIYLPQPEQLPAEQWTLGITSGGDYYQVKGVIETLVGTLNHAARLKVEDTGQPLLEPDKCSRLMLDGRLFGFLGEVSPEGLKQFGLRWPATVAELNLQVLAAAANLVPQYKPQSPYPAISRDLNLILDEATRWSELAATVHRAAGPWLEELQYRETYRDPQKDGPDKKRLLFSLTFRSPERTLTGEEADQFCLQVVQACQQEHRAQLLAG